MAAEKIRVLFGRKPGWENVIRQNLDTSRFEAVFSDLKSSDFLEFDIVVPLKLSDYADLNLQREFATRRAIFPAPAQIALCNSKLRLNQHLIASEFAWMVPPILDRTSPVPFILKRDKDAFGLNSHIVGTEQDRLSLADLIHDDGYFLQALVPGNREYAIHILMHNGRLEHHITVTYEMEKSLYVKGQNLAPKDRIYSNENPYISTFVDLLRFIGYNNGTCCIDYKVAEDKICLFEINPRFGSSLCRRINRYLTAYKRAVARAP